MNTKSEANLTDIDFTTQDFNEEDPKTWKDVDPKATTMAEVYKVNNRLFLDAKVNENSSEIWPWWEHLRLCGTRIGSVQVDHSTLDIFTNLDHNWVQFFLPGMMTTWKSPAQRQWRESSCTVTHWPDMVIKSESWEWAEILDTCFNFSLLNLSVMTICREVPLPLPPLWVGRTATGLCTLVRHLWRNLHAWQTHWRDCLRGREGEIKFLKESRN